MRIALFLLTLMPMELHGGPYQAVFITDADVAKLGGRFPLPRRHLAAAIAAAGRAEARAVVLKFFLDQPAVNPADDKALADAIRLSKIPVVLQANLESTEGGAVRLPARLHREDLPKSGDFIGGNKGWLPLPIFIDGAATVGFIDDLNPAPILEIYQGRTVPSLYLAALELVLGKASFTPGTMTLGARTLPLKGGKLSLPYPMRDDLTAPSLSELLAGNAGQQLKDAVVIIGYDGTHMDALPTPIGRIKKHRMFFYELQLAHAAFSGVK